MREIKFRAWDKAGDCWLQSALIQDFLSIGVPWTEKNEDGSFKLHQVSENRIEIMQYTGLKDKNGREVYEGDIVEVDSEGGYVGMDGDRGKVEMLMPWATWYVTVVNDGLGDLCYQYGVEVIGNIYENPELLK